MAETSEFDGWYRRESEGVLVFFSRRTLDGEIALDLTAETFAAAYRGWRKLRGRSAPERQAWLYVIARRNLARYWERGRVEGLAMFRLGICVPHVHEDDLAEIEERAGLGALREALAAELAQLGEDQRRALELRIVQERSYEEVAGSLGISEQAARARVSRALRALGQALEPHMTEASA